MTWSISDIPPQAGRRAIVTGTGGLGYEAALALARAGSDVVLAGRNPDKGKAAIDRIGAEVPDATIRFEPLDLASLASVEAFATRMLAEARPVDILLNNAGVMTPRLRHETSDGFELQFGTNYLGHFALTLRLMPLLLAAAAPRVVSVSSIAHRGGRIAFDDLQAERGYKPGKTYGQSKIAMLMFALELDRRAKAAGVALMSNAAHPGLAGTDLFTNSPGVPRAASWVIKALVLPLFGHSADAGTLPLLYAATAPDAQGGGYYGPAGFQETKGPPAASIIAKQATDVEAQRRLWEVSERLTGVVSPFGQAG